MSTLIACPTRGHVWYETAMSLAELATSSTSVDFLYVRNTRSVIEARNEVLAAFLESPHSALLMVDDDTIPSGDVMDLVDALWTLDEAGIVGAPTPIVLPGLPVVPNIYSITEESNEFAIDMSMALKPTQEEFVEVDAIGFGCVALKRSLVEEMPTVENRVDKKGNIYMGEDIDYCVRARSKRFKTYAAMKQFTDHVVEISAAGIARVYNDTIERIERVV